jgi:peptidyl-tRNA hydrolase, PTH2 family
MYKQAIVVRKDLEWGRGKLAAHAAHASVGAVLMSDQKAIGSWSKSGGKKVVLKVSGLKELKAIEKNAKSSKFVTFLATDAGLTQLKKGTVTALAIGPAEEKKLDKITGKLKLL